MEGLDDDVGETGGDEGDRGVLLDLLAPADHAARRAAEEGLGREGTVQRLVQPVVVLGEVGRDEREGRGRVA